ncbi:helix-turn-helix domain-containing protein [Zhenhengia yiwuensis]|uniref:Helix-turn-helix transcriptional regulator n=1 Tax=Zhenhengia yiwuensis TaxID=2763666 RepID=A0A926EJ87_9FIRM|nr:helix-turn-helix transcriptional regulator [Zhenhengia yiwuensis]MBC8579167.1 helix-turn-helix transcriptional regulator [Zhenhengia yiwuensis]
MTISKEKTLLGERIEMLCEEKKLTLVEVERACNLGNGTLRKWINGTVPNASSLSAIADYFKVSLDWLMGKSDNRSKFEEWSRKYDVERLKNEAKTFEMLGKIKQIFSNVELVDITEHELNMLQVYVEALAETRKKVLEEFKDTRK